MTRKASRNFLAATQVAAMHTSPHAHGVTQGFPQFIEDWVDNLASGSNDLALRGGSLLLHIQLLLVVGRRLVVPSPGCWLDGFVESISERSESRNRLSTSTRDRQPSAYRWVPSLRVAPSFSCSELYLLKPQPAASNSSFQAQPTLSSREKRIRHFFSS